MACEQRRQRWERPVAPAVAAQRLIATADAVCTAARTVNAAIAAPPERRSVRAFRQRPLIYGAMAVYAVASLALMATHAVGLTSEHAILLGLVAFAVFGRARPFVWDWLPFLFVGVMFEDLTAVGAKIAGAVHTVGPVVFERTFLGGAVAASWLQEHLGTGLVVRVLAVALVIEYLFHFAAPLVTGLWLWLRRRDRFETFVFAYILAMSAGFLAYLIYPEMPPWLAAKNGLLPHLHRYVVEDLQQVWGFGSFYAGADPEPNAAMPSLHVTIPMLVACTMAGVRGWHRASSWLWMLYPATISFGVIYLGEHYVADVVVGLILGVMCYLAADAGRRLVRSHEAAPAEERAPRE